MNHHDPIGFDCVIPSWLVLDNSIPAPAKFLYCIIRNLSRRCGYCYATNDYLAQELGYKKRRVQGFLEILEKEGYLRKEFVENGNQKIRTMKVVLDFQGKIRDAKRCTPPCKALHPPMQNLASPIYKDKKEDIKKKIVKQGDTGVGPPPAASAAPISPLSNKELSEEEELQKRLEALLDQELGISSAESSNLEKPEEVDQLQPQECPQDALEVAKFFVSKLKSYHPTVKDPDLKKWAKELELTHRIDKRPWGEIKAMICWAKDDPFWCANIMSPAALRKHWDKMEAKRSPPNVPSHRFARNRAELEEYKSSLKKNNMNLYNKMLIMVSERCVKNTETGETIPLDIQRDELIYRLNKCFNIRVK